MGYPDSEDYLHCFDMYGKDIRTIYLEEDDVRYEFLFVRILRLLIQSSPFNLKIPDPFKVTARKYLHGDPETRAHMNVAENRHFMLSDLYDFVVLHHKLKSRTL